MYTQTLKTTIGTLKVSIPTDLSEMTLGQLIAMQEIEIPEFFHEISILSGKTISELAQVNQTESKKELELIGERLLSLTHQLLYSSTNSPIPEFIQFGKKKVNVIKNLSVEPAGAFMAAKDLMADEINKHVAKFGGGDDEEWKKSIQPSYRACAMILAHYFYTRVIGGLYEEHKAEEFYNIVIELSVAQTLPIARYFFLNYPN